MMERTFLGLLVLLSLGALGLCVSQLDMYEEKPVHDIEVQRYTKDTIYCNGNECTYVFSAEIYQPSHYTSLITFLQLVPETTTITMYLAGNGGNAYTMRELVHSIESSSATIKGVVISDVHSAHAFIAASITSLTVYEGAFLMFHHAYPDVSSEEFCSRFKGQLTLKRIDVEQTCMKRENVTEVVGDQFTTKYAKRFLSEAQLIEMDKGHNIYITGEEAIRTLADE